MEAQFTDTTGSNIMPTPMDHSQGVTRTHLRRWMSNQPGRGNRFIYNREKMIGHMATHVTLNSLPLTYGESPDLEDFITLSLQPAYERICRNTIKDRIESQYSIAKRGLIEYFANFDGRVTLTIDVWISKQGESYLCIDVYWVNSDYFLQKRTIAFDVMDESDAGHNIYSQICETLDEFNLRDKIFSISFDKVNNTSVDCIDHIKNNNVPLLLDGVLLHVRFCAHIIHFFAQDGFFYISPLLTPIRHVIKWLRLTNSIKQKYKTLCKEKGLISKHFFIDTPTMWNSTYKMLVQALMYKDIIIDLYNEFHDNSESLFIDDNSWQLAQNICTLLKAYHHATNVFSLVNCPNVNLVIMECVNIVKTMADCEQNEPCLRSIIFEMKAKWLSYFHEFPVICGIACLLDPGIKSDGLTSLLDFYYKTLGIEYNVKKYVDYCVSILHKLYDVYVKDSDLSSSSMFKCPRFDNEIASIIYRKNTNVSNTCSSFIIQHYLSFTYETECSDFNIISWWHNRSVQYPVLSRIAIDVLAIPASTRVSQSTFSTGIEFLDENISCLSPDFVKIYVCKRDWDQAEIRHEGGGKKDDEDEDEDEDDPIMIMDTSSEEDN